MPERELMEILRDGAATWNLWRAGHPEISVNLTGANLKRAQLRGFLLQFANLGRVNLSEANLREADFSRSSLNWADLREADLRGAKLTGADLRGALVHGANLRDADLTEANLSGVDLSEINLSGATLARCKLADASLKDAILRDVDLSGANLQRANLRLVRLNGACLNGADLSETNATGADLRYTDLTGVDLRSARLQTAMLEHATADGVQLWESQRSGWSIRGIACERAYWDEKSAEVVTYAPGEFERLYSAQARVELVYHGGITPFEVNTLPALLHHLATLYPESGVRLKSIEETGGGVRVSIHVDDADEGTLDDIRAEAKQSQAAQIALRDDRIARLKIEKELLLDDVLPRMLAATGQQVQITGSATNVVIAGGRASVRADQRIENSEEMLDLLREMMARSHELPEAEAKELAAAVEPVEMELRKEKPRSSVIAAGLGVTKEILVKVVEGAGEKALIEHWQPMLHGLTHFLTLVSS